MALVLGTNCGFVTVAPTTDPLELIQQIDSKAFALKHTTPAGATKITEIGWWCDNATQEANFEVGIYNHDATNDKPDTVLGSLYQTNAKGTTAGWKTATVDINVSGNTIYWIAVQLDDTATDTNMNYASVGERRQAYKGIVPTLPSPWGTSAFEGNYINSFYALVEVAVGTNMKINISDVFKDIESLKINIGNIWKDVIKIQQNIGDVWKIVFG